MILGAPLGDEMDTTRTEYTPHDSYWGTDKTGAITHNCGPTSQFTSVQRFEHATFCWYKPTWRACLSSPKDAGHNTSTLPYCYELTDDAVNQPSVPAAPPPSSSTTQSSTSAVDPTTSTFTRTSTEVTTVVAMDYISLPGYPHGHIDPTTGFVHVVINGVDLRIDEAIHTGSTWLSWDRTSQDAVPLAQPGTSVSGFSDPRTGVNFITFQGNDRRIQLFRIFPDGTVIADDLTGLADVQYADPDGSPMGYVHPTTGHIHIVFSGQDARIYEFTSQDDGTSWTSTHLTTVAPLEYAAPGSTPFGFGDPHSTQRYVVFTGKNGRIQEAQYTGTTWLGRDITSLASVDYADTTASPSGVIDPFDHRRYIVFQTQGGRIHRFTYDGTTWTAIDVSGVVSVPLLDPGTSPMLEVNPITGEHRIVVQGYNHRITELRWDRSRWTSQDLTSLIAVEYAAAGSTPIPFTHPTTGEEYIVFTGVNSRIQLIRWGK